MAGRNFFYKKVTNVTNTAFIAQEHVKFPFQAAKIMILNDTPVGATLFSFDGANEDGELFCNDAALTFDGTNEGKLWFKTTNGANPGAFRVWAWRQ